MSVEGRVAVALVSAQASASAGLDQVCRWLIARQSHPVRIEVDQVPALGQVARLRLALPMTAPRAVLCAIWLFEDLDAGGCLLAGHLRFVAHPTEREIRLSFSGRTATAMRSGELMRQAGHAARQLLELIAESIERPVALAETV